jgi:hypothetical protein
MSLLPRLSRDYSWVCLLLLRGWQGSTASERPQDRIQHQVQFLSRVLRKKAQYEVAVLLEQLILAPVTAVGDRIREMLGTIQLHRDTGIRAQKVDFQSGASTPSLTSLCTLPE